MPLYKKLQIITLLLSNPKGFLIEQIENDNLESMLEEAFPSYEGIKINKNLIDNIVYDYTYLFVGASAPLASPYASSYYRKESRLMDEPAIAMIEIMNRWGISIDEDNRELPDHVVNMISLLSELLIHRNTLDNDILLEEIDKDIEKIKYHLKFLPELRSRIMEHEKGSFYSMVIDILIKTLN